MSASAGAEAAGARTGARRVYPTGPLWDQLCDVLVAGNSGAKAVAAASAAAAAHDRAHAHGSLCVPRDVVAIVHAFASANTRILCYGAVGGHDALPYTWSVYDPTHGHTVDPDDDAAADRVSASGSGSAAPQEQWSVEPAPNSSTSAAFMYCRAPNCTAGGAQWDPVTQQLRVLSVTETGYHDHWQSRVCVHVDRDFEPRTFVPFAFQPPDAPAARAGEPGPWSFTNFTAHSYTTHNYTELTSCSVDGVMYVFGRCTRGGRGHTADAHVTGECFDFKGELDSAHQHKKGKRGSGCEWQLVLAPPEREPYGPVRSACVVCAIPEHHALVMASGDARVDLFDCRTRTWHALPPFAQGVARPGVALCWSAPHHRLYAVCGGPLQDESSSTAEFLQFPVTPCEPLVADAKSAPAADATDAKRDDAPAAAAEPEEARSAAAGGAAAAAAGAGAGAGAGAAKAKARAKVKVTVAAEADAPAPGPALISGLAHAMADSAWRPLPAPLGYSRVAPIAVCVDGEVHCLGGIGMFGRRVNAVERWSVVRNAWIECPPAPVAVLLSGAFAIQHTL